jgi:hypothetical protein
VPDNFALDATIALAATKPYVNVELAEKKSKSCRRSGQRRKPSPNLTSARVNILKNNCAKSKKIAVVVFSVETKIEVFDVKKQHSDTPTLTSPQNTEHFVDMVPIKKTHVEKLAKIILNTNTVPLKTETTNEFKKQFR